MKKTALIILFLVTFAAGGAAQTPKGESPDQAELRAVLDAFMDSIKTKNAARFYELFHENPVVWIGVYKEKSQQYRKSQNPAGGRHNFAADDYKKFMEGIVRSKSRLEEKFDNIRIEEDGLIASVTFDYSFWSNGAKHNWGKENWSLIKADGRWKITSVIYSIEFEKVAKEPQR